MSTASPCVYVCVRVRACLFACVFKCGWNSVCLCARACAHVCSGVRVRVCACKKILYVAVGLASECASVLACMLVSALV